MIDIVIVNWNSGAQLQACVDSILAQDVDVVSRIIVVDNGSNDGSTNGVEGLPIVDVICGGENLGFAAGCNLGASRVSAPYILFLNPDTRVEKGSLTVPLAFMERVEGAAVGICGIQLVDEQGRVSRSCARFPTLGRLTVSVLGLDKLSGLHGAGMQMADWDHSQSRLVEQVMGAFFLVRRGLYEECGGFDERFFVYFEEVDFARRSSLRGWDSYYLADARAFHAGGGSSRQVKAHRLFYSLRSRLLYGFKHFSRWQAWVLVGLTGLLEPFTRTVWCLARGDGAGVRNTWLAYGMLWRGMDRIVRGQGRFQP